MALLFKFLSAHHHYNRQIQVDDIRMTFDSCDSVEERAKLLLFKIFNTQSQPKLDEMKQFFCKIEGCPDSLRSLEAFSEFLTHSLPQKDGQSKTTSDLFEKLNNVGGWGPKTAALFLRNLALIKQTQDLHGKFWSDIDCFDVKTIRLPVDKVILSIFSKLTVSVEDPTLRLKDFESINTYLKNGDHSPNDIVVWDDLWFWGYVTQKVVKNERDVLFSATSKKMSPDRSHVWNASKYWSIFTAPKNSTHIAEIKRLAEDEFLPLLK